MTNVHPAVRPARPFFSSGPCAKRPGWTPEALSAAQLGRSHRSKPGKARLKEAMDRTKAILGIPGGLSRRYRAGIGYGRDGNGAVVAARPAHRRLVSPGKASAKTGSHDTIKQLKLEGQPRLSRPAMVKFHTSTRPIPKHDIVFLWSGTTSGVRVAERRLDRRRPRRPDDLRRYVRRFCHGYSLGKTRCRHVLLAESARR